LAIRRRNDPTVDFISLSPATEYPCQVDFVNAAWYVLRSKPHKEHALYRQASLGKYEVYYPRLQVAPVNPRSRRIVPFFPGYMFIQIDLEQVGRSVFKWMPFSMGLVTFDNEPARVPEGFIDALQVRLDEIDRGGPQPGQIYSKGARVMMSHGPFEGYPALFDTHIPGGERAKVLIEFLSGQYVRFDVHINDITVDA
jgi:transcription antitermination factor NusG